MKKLMIPVILTLLMGCATIPNVVMKSSNFIVEAEGGFLECPLKEPGKITRYPFLGNVSFEGLWIIITPDTKKPIRKFITREYCKVYIMNGDSHVRQKNHENKKHKRLGNRVQTL